MKSSSIKLMLLLVAVILLWMSGMSQTRPGNVNAGVSVSFNQLNWLAGEDGMARTPIQHSFVGEVHFSFDRSAVANLVNKDAFINIVTQVNGKQEWSIQNYPVNFPTAQRLTTANPTAHFNLGTRNGQQVRNLSYLMQVTHSPLNKVPTENMQTANVKAINYKAAGMNGGFVPFPNNLPKAFVGINPGNAGPGNLALRRGGTKVGGKGIVKIVEDPMGCVPSGLARSICYLKPSGLTMKPQALYEALKAPLGWSATGGVSPGNIVSGKKSFTSSNNLNITTTAVGTPMTTSDSETGGIPLDQSNPNWDSFFNSMITALNNGSDVEILIRSVKNKKFFHFSMLTGVTVLPSGKVLVTVVENDSQGTPDTETNKEKTLIFDKAKGRLAGLFNYDIMLAVVEK